MTESVITVLPTRTKSEFDLETIPALKNGPIKQFSSKSLLRRTVDKGVNTGDKGHYSQYITSHSPRVY